MTKMNPDNRKIKFLKYFYLFLIIILFVVTVETPVLITSGLSFIREEIMEGAFIGFLLILSFIIVRLYMKELKKLNQQLVKERSDKQSITDRLNEAFQYIGKVNVEIDAIRSVFTERRDYPSNKSDMKGTMRFLAQKALNIIPADWVLLRIVNIENKNTIREYLESRGPVAIVKYEIPNKELVEGGTLDEFGFVTAPRNSLTIKAYCIFPKLKLSDEQQALLQAITSQLEMLYVIFDSHFYKYREE